MESILEYRDAGGARGSGRTELQTNLPPTEKRVVFVHRDNMPDTIRIERKARRLEQNYLFDYINFSISDFYFHLILSQSESSQNTTRPSCFLILSCFTSTRVAKIVLSWNFVTWKRIRSVRIRVPMKHEALRRCFC